MCVFQSAGGVFDLARLASTCPSADRLAMHTAAPKKENATVNPMVLIFMGRIETGFRWSVIPFPREQPPVALNPKSVAGRQWPRAIVLGACK